GQPAAEGHRDGLGAQRAGSLQLPGVAVVEGVVFGDDTGKFHGFSCIGSCVVHKFLSFCPFSLEKGPTLLYNVNEWDATVCKGDSFQTCVLNFVRPYKRWAFSL